MIDQFTLESCIAEGNNDGIYIVRIYTSRYHLNILFLDRRFRELRQELAGTLEITAADTS